MKKKIISCCSEGKNNVHSKILLLNDNKVVILIVESVVA
jgi:hypothetical protein